MATFPLLSPRAPRPLTGSVSAPPHPANLLFYPPLLPPPSPTFIGPRYFSIFGASAPFRVIFLLWMVGVQQVAHCSLLVLCISCLHCPHSRLPFSLETLSSIATFRFLLHLSGLNCLPLPPTLIRPPYHTASPISYVRPHG